MTCSVRERKVLEIAPGDHVALGMGFQPALAMAQQLIDLVVADPVVLFLVEHRHQDIEMLQDIGQACRDRQGDIQIDTVTPLRKGRIQGQGRGGNDVAQRFEQAAQDGLAAAARQDGQVQGEGQGTVGQVLAVLRPAGHGCSERLAQGDAEEGRSDIGPGH